MNMKAIYRLLTVALAMTAAVGCYENFETPAPVTRYDSDQQFEEAFADEGLECVSIETVKNQFSKFHGSISNTGNNNGWGATKTVKFGQLSSMEQGSASDHIAAWPEAANYYIKGKVISDDTQGNVYKSLYIFDGTAGIELKLTNGLFLNYPQGSWVYVKLRDLYLGNYRMMLSIGNGPTSSYNVVGEEKYYANSNIEDAEQIKEHIFLGREDTLTVGTDDTCDIMEVDENTYMDIHGKEKYFGRMICFKGVSCYYAGVKNQNGETNMHLINGSYEQFYPSWIDTNIRPVVNKAWYKWAYSYNGVSLYGSVCFTYLSHETLNSKAYPTSTPGIYTVRSSGYSRFAGRPVPRDGAKADITAIYGIYSQRSDYSGTSDDWASYQLTVNRLEDMVFYDGDAAFLTDGTTDTNGDGVVDEHDSNEVLTLTPNGFTYNEEEGRFVYNSDNDSYYVPSAESSDRDDTGA